MAWRGRRPTLRYRPHSHIAYQQALPLPGRANWHASTAPSSAVVRVGGVVVVVGVVCSLSGQEFVRPNWQLLWLRLGKGALEQGLRGTAGLGNCLCGAGAGAGADLLRRQCALLAKIQKQSTNCACSRTNVSDRYVFIHSTIVLCMQQVAECVLYCTFLISISQTRRDETRLCL